MFKNFFGGTFKGFSEAFNALHDLDDINTFLFSDGERPLAENEIEVTGEVVWSGEEEPLEDDFKY